MWDILCEKLFQNFHKLKKKNEDEKNEDFFYLCYDVYIQNVKTSKEDDFKNVLTFLLALLVPKLELLKNTKKGNFRVFLGNCIFRTKKATGKISTCLESTKVEF